MNRSRLAFFASTLIAICLTGCAAPPAALTPAIAPTTLDLVDQAAAEATAILQQARATALVLQARAQATQLIGQAGSGLATPAAADSAQPMALPVQATPAEPETPAANAPSSDPTALNIPAAPETVDLLGVGFAADGGFIIVNFKAPTSITQTWWQGSVEVIDEASGTVYNEIPVLPVIGPLIGRPVEAGQLGYVMLTHNPPRLQVGVLVTVILGEYKFEHVKVE